MRRHSLVVGLLMTFVICNLHHAPYVKAEAEEVTDDPEEYTDDPEEYTDDPDDDLDVTTVEVTTDDVEVTTIDSDPCESVTCSNGGNCTEEDGDAVCDCLPNYDGEFCETNVSDVTTVRVTTVGPCEDVNCSNAGNCTVQDGAAVCDCQPNYAGDICETFNDPCDDHECNKGECKNMDDGSAYCDCPEIYEGDNCETLKDLPFKAAFTAVIKVLTINNATAEFVVAYNDATSTEYQDLQQKLCDWVKNGIGGITDCSISNVVSGSLIATVDLFMQSLTELSSDDFDAQLKAAYEADPGIFTFDTDNLGVEETQLLQCPTCSIAEFSVVPDGFPDVISGDPNCIEGTGISSFGCDREPSTGRTHQCLVFDNIQKNEEYGIVRQFMRQCISATPQDESYLEGTDAYQFATGEVDYEEGEEPPVTEGSFLRGYLCTEDDCKSDFTPCDDPRQVKCYSSSKCIYLSQFCDQRDDCAEAEDEAVALCGVPPPCTGPTDYKCTEEDDPECKKIAQVCDGIADCSNAKDEAECEGTCTRPFPPSNGFIIDPVPVYQNGGTVAYGCNDGFTLVGSNQHCVDGALDGSAPQCINNCVKPNVNDENVVFAFNGIFDNGARYPHNNQIALECSDGYSLDPADDENTFTCDEGDWVKEGTNNPDGFICKNINECEDEDTCPDNSKCTDSLGSYKCTCNMGYYDTGDDCSDVDECAGDDVVCAENADCTNSEGSYICECSDGYKGDGYTECIKDLFLPYNEPGTYTYSLRTHYDYYARWWRNEYISWYIRPPSGFPFGKDYFRYLYLTADGVVVLQSEYKWWKNSFPYPFGSVLGPDDLEAVIAPFWTKSDFSKGGNVYYQTYYAFWQWPSNYEEVFAEINGRIQSSNNEEYDDFVATWALVITWENMPEVTSSAKTEFTNTFQTVLATDGLRSFVFFVYKNDEMKWQALEQKNAVIGFNNPLDAADPKNLHSGMTNKYTPDKETGNQGYQGYWMYRLDDNDVGDVNPSKYCEDWASDQPSISYLKSVLRPCPCSAAQAVGDSRYTKCERISIDDLDDFDSPAEDVGQCFQQVWPRWIYHSGNWYTAGVRCSYNADGALITGYEDVWANSNAQLYHGALGGGWYFAPYASKVDWRDEEVLARYYCCKKSAKCDLYEEHRPALTCEGYRQVQPGCFYGDPHIVTLDSGTFTFNGLGEYIMVEVDGIDFELQGRTGLAMSNGTIIEGGGTVFVAFAAQMGITTVEFILNDNRTEFITVVNGTDLVNDTMLKAGESYFNQADSSFTIDYTAPTNTSGGRIAARWTTTLPGGNDTDIDFTVSAGVKLAMLDIIVEVPPELTELSNTKGLMGVYNEDNTDDFVFPNGSMLTPADGNLTESEIFNYGETWRTTADSSLFSYIQEGGNWSTYNDLDFVPLFLDELLEKYEGTAFLDEVYAVCGMENRECLFDSLATNNTEIGGNTKATDEMFQELVSNLNNFPPNISVITETSNTDSLQYEERLLQLEVGGTYTYQVEASDANDDDIMYSLPYDDLGATIDANGEITLSPTSAEEAKFEVAVSDGRANSSITFKVHVCSCENDGTCNWNDTSSDGTFAVAPCICTAGWSGDDCSTDVDSCAEKPCFPGVLCQDQPPPEVNATCGSCPTGLQGDGFKCYDFNECADVVANDCNHTCTNNLGSYVCSCDDGYTLHQDGRRCNDIDECTLNTHDCDNNATCNNIDGSFECPCNDGYEKVDGDCLDIDECLAYPCSNIASCINYAGSFTCQCPEGYFGDGVTCTDIDECLGDDTNDCHEMATCKNLAGSYQCTCNAGWEGNGKDCSDVDECKQGTASCHSRANCTNTEGSYICNCQLGFIGDGLTCTDIDECASQIDDCVQVCNNTAPNYVCDCQDGFELDADGKSCNVAAGSECDDTSETCNDLGKCIKSGGTDGCVCDRGAVDSGDTCEDVDECTDGTHDCDADHGTCSNTSPGYSCSCETGYELDNDARTCRDIDECIVDDPCHAEATCSNTDGSYNCTCNEGYGGDGSNCSNINECETQSNVCAENGACTDTEGSYTCACNEGYQGDGYNTCEDVNECNNVGVCDEEASCNNTVGSYTCECNVGYFGDGETCEDIDECTSFNSPHECPDNSRCINSEGSYSCTCEDGYEQSPFVNGVFTCLDIDECDEGFDDCDDNADCTNTGGSFECDCQDGYEGTGKTCTDINECEISIPCSPDAKEKCENRVGSSRCICQLDYFKQGEPPTCQASMSRSLEVLFSRVKALDPLLYFDDVNTQDNRDALSDDITTLFNASDISADFLGASVEEVTSTDEGALVIARLDFTAASEVTDAEVKLAFLAGLSGDMFLGTDSQVVSVNVTLPVTDPCVEGTHNCFENNFVRCVFVDDGQFDCENCSTGYRLSDDGETCEEILPCTETLTICTANDFINCVPDGPGEYHCENCKEGYDQQDDVCIEPKIVKGQFTMTSIGGGLAEYTSDLADASSSKFMQLAGIVCTEITSALSANSTVYDCEVIEFQSGSIIAIYAITLDNNESPDEADLLETLKTNLLSSSSFGVDNTSFVVIDICGAVNCMNGGECTVDANFDGICSCTSGYQGDLCETKITTSVPVTTLGPKKKGLTTGEIVGIAIGCFVFVILVVIIVIVICKVCIGKNKVADDGSGDLHRHDEPEDAAGASQPHVSENP